MDRAARRAHPQGRLRLRDAALRPPQVRRHDHEHGHLPADAGPLRAPDPAADRRRLRRLRRPRPPLPGPGGLDARGQQVRDRHLDDHARPRGRVRRLRDAPGRQGPRPEGPLGRPRADVPPGRRDDPRAGRPPPRRVARDHGQPRGPGLRLRALGGAERAPGEHAAPPLRVRGRAGDPRRHLAGDARPEPRGGRRGARDRSRQARRAGVAAPRAGRDRERLGRRHHRRDERSRRRLPLPRRAVGGDRLRPRRRGPLRRRPPRAPRGGARAPLLRTGWEPRRREPKSRPGGRRGARRAPGPGLRAAQALPGRTLAGRGSEPTRRA